MSSKKNGMNDSDKIFVTVALWIAMISLFATALTLPMLPEHVSIFQKPAEDEQGWFRKYSNLMLILSSVIPTLILLVTATLRKHGKIQRNFPSIMLFCIMLSGCMGGVTIYGISRQFAATTAVRNMDVHTVIALTAAFFLSSSSAVMPMIMHTESFKASSAKLSVRMIYACRSLDRFWNVGAYGFLAVGITCSFCTGFYTYIPFGIGVVAGIVFLIVTTHMGIKHKLETLLYDAIDSRATELHTTDQKPE